MEDPISDPWVSSATDSIFLRIVNSEKDIVDKVQVLETESQPTKKTKLDPNSREMAVDFHPDYSHQVFSDELIYGYKNPRIDMWFASGSFVPYVSVKFSAQKEQAEDLFKDSIAPYYEDDYAESNSKEPFVTEFIRDRTKFTEEIQKPFLPPGTLIYSKEDPSLEIYHGTFEDPNVGEYHQRLQIMSIFHIDGANTIDLHDECWNVFYLYRKISGSSNQNGYQLVGFCTAYPFYSYPSATRLRISQFVIFPPFRRKGFAGLLVDKIFDYACKNHEIRDVTLEEPSEDFSKIRDVITFKRCLEDQEVMEVIRKNDQKNSIEKQENDKEKENVNNKDLESLHKKHTPLQIGLSKSSFLQIQKKTKLSQNQILKCYEVIQLFEIQKNQEPNDQITSINQKKRLENIIKQRLTKTYQLRLGKLENSPSVQAFKEKQNQEIHQQYEVIVSEYMNIIEKYVRYQNI